MRASLDPEVMTRRAVAMKACGCPTNGAGDIRCHRCLEYVNVRCWNCKTIRTLCGPVSDSVGVVVPVVTEVLEGPQIETREIA